MLWKRKGEGPSPFRGDRSQGAVPPVAMAMKGMEKKKKPRWPQWNGGMTAMERAMKRGMKRGMRGMKGMATAMKTQMVKVKIKLSMTHLFNSLSM